jgi:hypothetical protein
MRFVDASSAGLAASIGRLAHAVLAARGPDVVLVSIARGGTPAGVLLRRYLRARAGLDVKHYSLSFARPAGIDMAALQWIATAHGSSAVQLVDGWTGKGTVQRHVAAALRDRPFGPAVDGRLAVVSDPGGFAAFRGTRDDILLPNACLHAQASGLVSSPLATESSAGGGAFHEIGQLPELAEGDLSVAFIDRIAAAFAPSGAGVSAPLLEHAHSRAMPFVQQVADRHADGDIDRVHPGLGETVRLLLKGQAARVLVQASERPGEAFVAKLARRTGIPVERLRGSGYGACGVSLHPPEVPLNWADVQRDSAVVDLGQPGASDSP